MPNIPDQETNAKLMPGEAAARLGVTTKTLTVMSALHPIVLPSGHRRYLAAEVEALLLPPTTSAESSPPDFAEVSFREDGAA